MTLWDYYHSIFDNRSLWQYYQDMPHLGKLTFSENYCRLFINNYLNTGFKCSIPGEMPSARVLHTVSLFFLGLCLFYNVFEGGKYSETERSAFIHYWFLTCFYHDCGYIYECKISPWRMNTTSMRAKLKSILSYLPSSLDIVKSPQLIIDYYEYRKAQKCYDHGITGAIKTISDLQNNHRNLLSKIKAKNIHDIGSSFFPGTKIKLTSDSFPYVAATIAVHNIWMGNSGNAVEYTKHGLGSLINGRYIYGDDALLFWILQIADTLEPIKKLCGSYTANTCLVNHLLHSIDMEFAPYRIMLKCDVIIPQFDVHSWYTCCETISKWTNIDVGKKGSKSIVLVIPGS